MTTRELVHRILSAVRDASFAVEYWDGEEVSYGPQPADFVLHLKDEATCRDLLGDLSLRFGEAYMSGAIEVSGDLQKLVRLLFVGGPDLTALEARDKLALARLRWRGRRRRKAAAADVARHYDLGNDFFKLWLGHDMAYSCAYFQSSTEDLDTAQQQKFRHICAKLRLERDQRLLDIGCGWGSFLVHAATHHGIRGLGVTLSREQKEGAEQRVAAHGLSDRVRIERLDYRDLAEGGFDRIVSIGMFEHVGRPGIPEYLAHTARLLRAGGVGVLHTIGRQVAAPPNPWLAKYIFPGAYFPALGDIATPMGAHGLDIADVEVWRLHYALTLDRWLEAYTANVETVRAMYGEVFTRMWRLYLASCAASFRYGDYCVWQIQFTKGLDNNWPLTREYLHR